MKPSACSFVAVTVFAAAAASAQMKMDDMKGMEVGKKPVASQHATHVAKAEVKKADAKAGIVTLAHEPVTSLNWPAMTMSFKVNDKKLWKKLDEGKTVEVEFVQQGKDYVVTTVK